MNQVEFESTLPTLYIDTSGNTMKGLTIDEVRYRLISKGYVLGQTIDDVSILDPSLKKVEYVINPKIFPEGTPIKYELSTIRMEYGVPIIRIDVVKDEAQLRYNAISNRAKRNKLLETTDWIESSSAVTPETKAAYKAYRQLLRDIFLVLDESRYTNLPTPPDVVMKTTQQVILTEDIVQQIKDYIPDDTTGWSMFLKEWGNLNFTPNRLIVNSLLGTYANTTFSKLMREL
jgi:hypothetical protein